MHKGGVRYNATFNNVGGKKFKDYKLDIEQNHVSLSKLCTGPKILNLTETYQLSRFIDMNMHMYLLYIWDMSSF